MVKKLKIHIISFLIFSILNFILQALFSMAIDDEVNLMSLIVQSIIYGIFMTYFMAWFRKREAKKDAEKK